jgi:hypothetical protein
MITPTRQMSLGQASDDAPVELQLLGHGMISGATGTGKTVSAQVLIEELSRSGIPVLAFDWKGDLAGLARAAAPARAAIEQNLPVALSGLSVRYWDPSGVRGTPLRLPITHAGPTFVSDVLGLRGAARKSASRVMQAWADAALGLDDFTDLLEAVSISASQANKLEQKTVVRSLESIRRAALRIISTRSSRLFGSPLALPTQPLECDAAG